MKQAELSTYRGKARRRQNAEKMGRKQLFRLGFLVIGVVFVINILIFLNLHKELVQNELAALYLIPKPETMTELYFNNSANLPGTVTNNQFVSFAFVIHDLEATDYQYSYNVDVITNGTRHSIDRGNALVKNNQYYVKNEKFQLTHASTRQEIVVELTNKQQSIDFWIGD